MADPTSLKFDIILNDKDFKTQINADIELARKLNEQVSKSLNMGNLTQAATKTAQATEKVTTATKEVTKAQKGAQAAIEQSAKSLTTGSGSITRAWLRFSATMWSVISAVRLFTQTIGKAIKNITDFQQANANLATIMQVSRKDIETLTNDALMLGRTTEWTASQVTELQTALAKLGFNIPQIRNMQASVLQFATAVGAKLPDAANLAGASLRMFGMRSSEMQKALEILAASTNKTALDFEKLKVSLPYVGAIAHSIGFDIAQTASLLGVLTNAGLESSRAGTGLRQVLLELSKTNGKLQTAMGGNVKSFDDFVNALRAMRDRGLEAGEATKLVSTRASSALLILANGVDDIARLNEEVRDTDGLLKTIQSERLDTLHGSTLLLKSAWEGLIQTFRDSAGPMKDIVDWLTQIIRATSLAASRANRVAQGTKDVMGSDEITTRFKQRFEQLLEDEKTPEQAAEIVRNEMQKWIHGAYSDLAVQQRRGYKETGFRRFLYDNPVTGIFMRNGTMGKGRAANEQVEAVENAYDAVVDYMENRSKEEGEIAANNFLEQWKATFDAEGAAAARKAMSQVAGYENIKAQVEAYIANGGAAGAQDRGKGSASAAEKARKELINDLKSEAAYLRKLYDDLKKLEPYLDENGVSAKMAEIFGEGDYSKENIEQGILDIASALKGMGEEGKDAAEELLRSWGLDNFSRALKQLEKDKKAADDAQKSLNKYLETLQDWADKNQELSGTGSSYDISKAIATYRKAVADANKKGKTALGSLLYGTGNNEERMVGFANINKEWVESNANALVTLRNSITNLADDILKEQLEKGGFDLTDFNDKTLSQLNDLKRAVSEVELPDDVKAMLKDYPELLKALDDEMAKLKQAKIDKTIDPEKWKKIAKQAKYIAERFLSVSESLKSFADATGNTALSNTAEAVGRISQNLKSAYEGFKAGGGWGALIGGASDIITQILDSITETEKEATALKDALRSIATDTEIKGFANDIKSAGDSIWGENALGEMQEAISKLREVEERISKIRGIMKGGEIRPNVLSSQGNYTGVEFTRKKENLFNLADMWSLEKIAAETGMKILDDYKNFNVDLLNWIKQAGWDLTEAEKDWLDEAIVTSTNYAEAMKVVEKTAESILNGAVTNVADKIVDSWWEAGRAALDYSDILEDVAKGYAKLVAQDALIDAAFSPERKKAFIEALKSGDPENAMAIVSEAMQAAKDMLPTVEQALQVFEPYRNMGGGESNSVGSGIKSITEDTASLLASYINAIRADVSYIRLMQEKGWGVIENLGVSLPTLNDYMNQVAANTYDTAQNTQAILSELQSVIGSPGTSGMVVRVETY